MAWKFMPSVAWAVSETAEDLVKDAAFWVPGGGPFEESIGRSRTSSICWMGVMPAMGSLLNWPMR